jgi:hypothetical protein
MTFLHLIINEGVVMQSHDFKASVQYGDWKGTVAADGADKRDARAWLREHGYIQEGEFLLGITFFAGENHGSHKDPVSVEFMLAAPGDHDSIKAAIETGSPVVVRRVRVEMGVADFLGLFKRFSVYFSVHGMMEGRQFTFPDL